MTSRARTAALHGAPPPPVPAGAPVQASFAPGAGPRGRALLPGSFRPPTTGGQPLPEGFRRQAERLLGNDFSAVRVHVSPQAKAIGALAFTVRDSIVIAPGRYAPDTLPGRELLLHELTHVVQQRMGRVPMGPPGTVQLVNDRALEAEAELVGRVGAVSQGRGHELDVLGEARDRLPYFPLQMVQASGGEVPVVTVEQKMALNHLAPDAAEAFTKSTNRTYTKDDSTGEEKEVTSNTVLKLDNSKLISKVAAVLAKKRSRERRRLSEVEIQAEYWNYIKTTSGWILNKHDANGTVVLKVTASNNHPFGEWRWSVHGIKCHK